MIDDELSKLVDEDDFNEGAGIENDEGSSDEKTELNCWLAEVDSSEPSEE